MERILSRRLGERVVCFRIAEHIGVDVDRPRSVRRSAKRVRSVLVFGFGTLKVGVMLRSTGTPAFETLAAARYSASFCSCELVLRQRAVVCRDREVRCALEHHYLSRLFSNDRNRLHP